MNSIPIIKTDRLTLKVPELKDKDIFFSYRSHPEIYKYQSWKPATIDEVEYFFSQNMAAIPNTKNTWLQLGAYLRNGPLIGDMGLHFLEDDAQVEIGYTLSPEQQGRGYAFEAVKVVLDYLFLSLKKHRVTASVDPDNQKSINLLKKIGFRQEAHFKKSTFIRGEWCDDLIFAMLEEEWNSLR